MPTYDYQCRDCGNVIEVIHSMLADGPSVCERCGGELRRVIYPTGIIFKGSGFYRTDSRTKPASEPGSPAAAGASTGSDGQSSDKKPAKDSSSSTSTKGATKESSPT